MTCDRLERDDLLGHLGEEMDPHVEQCHVCRATSYGYARLAAALAEESTRAPPPGWKERTLARIHAAQAARRRRHTAASVGLSLAGAAVLALIFSPRDPDPGPESDGLVVSLERREGRRGAASTDRAQPGDRLHASAPARSEHGELRIYRESRELMVRCPGARPPTCQRRADTIEISWTLPGVGIFQVLWLDSSAPLPRPSGDLDADLLAAERAGARVVEHEPIDVD